MDKQIEYYTIPLKVEIEKLQPSLSDNEKLHEAIVAYSEELAKEDIET